MANIIESFQSHFFCHSLLITQSNCVSLRIVDWNGKKCHRLFKYFISNVIPL